MSYSFYNVTKIFIFIDGGFKVYHIYYGKIDRVIYDLLVIVDKLLGESASFNYANSIKLVKKINEYI
ncbi:hypothetical protein CJF42_21935 [Pseudoalteromonas sp. NBT06-2]|nr:hypothetical protein CJF42_21935 [Pseudoalteromonas sp. NBT06-2]